MASRTQTGKIALQLFEAGYTDVQEYRARAIRIDEDTMWLPPTLDQLIQSCGDHFGKLERKPNMHPWLTSPKNEHKDFVTFGGTAWDSTANFWLGLRYAQIL